MTFLSDNRADLDRVRTPSLVLQCADDVIAPEAVGEYVHAHLPGSRLVQLEATGHCPNLSAPEETVAAIQAFLHRRSGRRRDATTSSRTRPAATSSRDLDGTIRRVNRDVRGADRARRETTCVGRQALPRPAPAGRAIYHETHFAPLLRMQGAVREIAVDVVRADGTRLPALVNSVVRARRRRRAAVRPHDDLRRDRPSPLRARAARRARRKQEEIALELQRSLLAGALPAAAGLEVAVAYRPAVRRPRGRRRLVRRVLGGGGRGGVGLVVGDVVGRGIEAAATMGQLRSAVRALASTGLGPAALLSALDGYSARHGVGRMTTIVYAELELADAACCATRAPGTRRRRSSAGDEPRLLWEGRSPPLDALPGAARAAAGGRLSSWPPARTVLLYTDGLVERRRQTLTDGLDELLRHGAALREATPAAITTLLLRDMPDRDHADDVCLLAARVGALTPRA